MEKYMCIHYMYISCDKMNRLVLYTRDRRYSVNLGTRERTHYKQYSKGSIKKDKKT